MNWEVLTLLLIAHAISDGSLQTSRMGSYKKRNTASVIMFLTSHCITVAGVNYLFFPYLWVFWLTFTTHWAIDFYTSRKDYPILDQFLHASVIGIIYLILTRG